tara:strand:- start:16005 stop:16949 length:945 start_codon:yes stop_codon:yes gene_type:complete
VEKKNRAVFGILIMVFFFFIVLMIFATYTLKIFSGEEGSSTFGAMKKDGATVAVVELNGVIMESKKTVELIHKAYEDKQTKAILIRINSPGGAVGPTQEIYEEIRRIDQMYVDTEGKEGKPVYSSFGSIAASGGYYIGASTRKIFSNAGTITGSIGVIMQFMDLSKLYELARVKQETIKSGRFKDFGQPTRGMTQEEIDMLNSTVEGVHKQFMDDIKKTRKGKIKKDLFELAQGQIFSGEEALNLGLVDELAGMWSAGRKIHEELKLEGEFGFKFIKEKKKSNFWAVVEDFEGVLGKVKTFLNQAETPALMYRN